MARYGAYRVRVRTSGNADIEMLRPLRTLPGVQITLVGGLNGRGQGVLRYYDGDLSWQAPGSGTRGAAVDVSGGGTFWLIDGENLDKWVKVSVAAGSLPDTLQTALVELTDVWLNGVASTDKTVGAGGDNWDVWICDIGDLGGSSQVTEVTAWLDPDEPANRLVTLTPAGGGACQPWNETEALTLFGSHTIAADGHLVVTITRTAGAAAAILRRVRGWVSWNDQDGGRAYTEFRGLYRLEAAAVSYEAYYASATDPVPGHDTPIDTSASVPWTPADVYGDGTHHVALVKVNKLGLRSSPRRIVRVKVSGGAEVELPPTEPDEVKMVARPSGKVRVLVRYARPVRSDVEADEFALWYTTDGSAPSDAGAPDYTAALQYTSHGRYGVWVCDDIPAQGDGVQVRVLVEMRTTGGTKSGTGLSASHTVSTTGPTAPPGGVFNERANL